MKNFSGVLIVSTACLLVMTACIEPVRYHNGMSGYVNPYVAPGYGGYNYNPYPVVSQPYFGGGREYRDYGNYRQYAPEMRFDARPEFRREERREERHDERDYDRR